MCLSMSAMGYAGVPGQGSSDVNAAFASCSKENNAGSEGFDNCMAEKGFKKLSKMKHEDIAKSGIKDAFTTCLKERKGKIGEPAFDACMAEKGFKKP